MRPEAGRILAEALARGEPSLSEYEGKRLLAAYGIPVTREVLVAERSALGDAAGIGYPVALKAGAPGIAHKSDAGLVRLGLRDAVEALAAYDAIVAVAAGPVLVQEMVPGSRELAAGLVRDADFGPCVMFGLGGILTEALGDVTFRRAPLTATDALDMLEDIRGRAVLGSTRGLPAADRGALAAVLVALGQIGLDHPRVREIDVNPVILSAGRPVAADALIVLDAG